MHSAFVAFLALSAGQPPYPPPPAAPHYPPPYPFHPNFVVPAWSGPVPNYYPIVPTPVVLAHPSWYPYPGPAWWYTNAISPYNPVRHLQSPEPEEPDVPPAKDKTLYERLGGAAGVRAVVDDFVARAAANPAVNFTRKGTPAEWKATPENVDKLKKALVDFIGSATGGPQKYTGKDMKSLHAGMKITQAEFDAAAADLKASLDKAKVPAKEQRELLKVVAGTAPDIVEKQRN
jgi:hemoglobin